jgi:hypothetical protein
VLGERARLQLAGSGKVDAAIAAAIASAARQQATPDSKAVASDSGSPIKQPLIVPTEAGDPAPAGSTPAAPEQAA